jgi:UDP-N-acetyl-D-galactosamine dehydrogenase
MTVNKICIIGLGYVGLPLAAAFSKKFDVVGFDINENRIKQLKDGIDVTDELNKEELNQLIKIKFCTILEKSYDTNIYIVTVPTPITRDKNPDLKPLKSASEAIGRVIKTGDIVIYESTVYPGVTEDICVPIIEKISNLKLNIDFCCGYSPERINPGDKNYRLKDIKKVTSGSSPAAAKVIDELYNEIIDAGTYQATSIKVAEAAKVIENTQRDLNIALVNELSIIFNKIGIDTSEVLAAAATKWNFIKFSPGLVGGHCIGVDPYYLASLAQSLNINPEVILAGRRINEGMVKHSVSIFVKELVKKSIDLSVAKILVCGYTFKENCPDTRNTKVYDLVAELVDFGLSVDVYDPVAEGEVLNQKHVSDLRSKYDGVILAVPHACFIKKGEFQLKNKLEHVSVLFDLKGVLGKEMSDLRL